MVYKWVWAGITAIISVFAIAEAINLFGKTSTAKTSAMASADQSEAIVLLLGSALWCAIALGFLLARDKQKKRKRI